MALARLRCAVRLRTEGLGKVRIRRRGRSADAGGNVFLSTAGNTASRDRALGGFGNARGSRAGEFQDVHRERAGVNNLPKRVVPYRFDQIAATGLAPDPMKQRPPVTI